MADPKYSIGDRVTVLSWGGTKYPGTIVNRAWVYHHRVGEHTWGYAINFDDGTKNPFTFNFIPQSYMTALVEEPKTNLGRIQVQPDELPEMSAEEKYRRENFHLQPEAKYFKE